MTTATIDVTALTVGSITANSLSPTFFTNPADTVSSNTFWTPSGTKYLAASSNQNYIVKTVPANDARDTEVTSWVRDGYMYIRLDGTGKAIYLYHNGETTHGTLEVGIVTGLNESTYPSGTYYVLYQRTDCDSSIPGYNKTDTTGATFTLGASGFDIYIKFNGTEFCRFKDYRHMAAGAVALKANNGYGVRSVTWTSSSNASLFSNYASSELDLRDWNVRSIATTGSISSGSGSLTVASATNFQVGDWVIAEIGQEAGGGQRGTIGIGGQWPLLKYTNFTTMSADNTQAPFTYALRQDTGEAYQYSGTSTPWSSTTIYNLGTSASYGGNNYTSINQGPNINNQPDISPAAWQNDGSAGTWVKNTPLAYYTAKAIPLSLHGRITNIAGNVLTLVDEDGTAISAGATASGVNVYLNIQPYVNYLTGRQHSGAFYSDLRDITPSGMTVIFPSGVFYGAGQIVVSVGNNWTIKGQGQASTSLVSPKGVYPLHFAHQEFTGYTIKDLTIQGNFGTQQFGMAFPGFTYIPGGLTFAGLMPSNPNTDDNSVITQNNITQGACYPGCLLFFSAHNSTAQDITANDYPQKIVSTSFANNVFAYRVTNNENSILQNYVQWQFQWADSDGGGAVDCVLNSGAIRHGFESFHCTNCDFLRCILNNGALSQNNSEGWLIKDCIVTITASSSLPPAWDKNNPLTNINSNAGADRTASGGTISNLVTNVLGYVTSNNDVPCGISINADNPNVTVIGGSYTAPSYASPSTLIGPQGVRSTGTNTNVINFRCAGTTAPGGATDANIGISDGSVTYCIADTILSPSTYGNTSYSTWASVAPPFPIKLRLHG